MEREDFIYPWFPARRNHSHEYTRLKVPLTFSRYVTPSNCLFFFYKDSLHTSVKTEYLVLTCYSALEKPNWSPLWGYLPSSGYLSGWYQSLPHPTEFEISWHLQTIVNVLAYFLRMLKNGFQVTNMVKRRQILESDRGEFQIMNF